MVVISERSVRRIIEDVAPKVERLTGWNPHLNDLEVRIIKRDQYFQEGMVPTYAKLGIDTEAKTADGMKTVKMLKIVSSYLMLGQYIPITGTLLIIPDNIRFGTNESGLALTLGHELVHRCQFINNPKFAQIYNQLVKRSSGTNAFDEDGFEDKGVMDYLQSYMTLVEGDASFVQGQLKNMFYQDAKNKTSGISNFIGLLLMLASSKNGKEDVFGKKLDQYSKGRRNVRRVYQNGGRESVNALYKLNDFELTDAFINLRAYKVKWGGF